MATIRKRGNKFQVQIRRAGYPTLSRSFLKKSDAEAWGRHNESLADRGKIPQSTKTLKEHTLSSILIRYKEEISKKKKSHNSEKYILEALIRQSFAKKTLDNILLSDFIAYRDTRLQSVKAGTVGRELSIIKHAFDVAMKEWDIPLPDNPLDKIKKLKVQNARTRRLQEAEWIAIEQAATSCRNPFILLIIKLALYTGMRRGELLNLRWDDIDTEKRTLFIPVAKNGHSRKIPLSMDALAVLEKLGQINCNDVVFPISANSVRLSWERLIKRAGIEDLHFHDLRHEAISRFFEKGLSVPEVALISGHRDFRMLFRYTHLRAEDVAKKING